jgi:hypothetical protein
MSFETSCDRCWEYRVLEERAGRKNYEERGYRRVRGKTARKVVRPGWR